MSRNKKRPRYNPSEDNNFAIRTAAKEGHTDVVVELLLYDRVDPSAATNEAIRRISTEESLILFT